VDQQYECRIRRRRSPGVVLVETRAVADFLAVRSEFADLSALTRLDDLATIGDYGVESDPRAYRVDGEFKVSRIREGVVGSWNRRNVIATKKFLNTC